MSGAVPGYRGLPEGRWLDVNGLRTWYTEAGTGTPIVFVYGGNFGTAESASGAYAWDMTFPELSSRFRTIVYDKPGQGLTEAPADDRSFTMATVVDHLIALIELLDVPPVHLVGHSRGGYAATRATLQRPDLVRSLTIVNSGTLSPGVGTNELELSRPPFPPYSRESARWVYEHYVYRAASVTDDWVEQSFEIISRPDYRATVERLRSSYTLATEFLPGLARDKAQTLTWLKEGRLQRPTQIVWGRDDRTAHLQRGYDLFETISAGEPRTVLNVVDKSGHFPYREHPSWFNDALAAFVATAGYEHG